jgi:hypothetical protein
MEDFGCTTSNLVDAEGEPCLLDKQTGFLHFLPSTKSEIRNATSAVL